MPITADETARRVDAIGGALRAHGLKLTHQRLEVVREIAATDEHPDVETVFHGVRKRVPTISLDTVYRTLAVLVSHGLIEQVTATPGPARYDANTVHHHHFVCSQCGLLRDIDSEELDAISATDETGALGRIDSVHVQFRGSCVACEKG